MLKRGTVFFDIGGPVLDEHYFNIALDGMLLRFLRKNGVRLTIADLKHAKEKAVQEWAVHYHRRVFQLLAGRHQSLQANAIEVLGDMVTKARKQFRLRKGVELVLQDLSQEWHIGIASKLSKEIVLAELARFEIIEYFDIIPPKKMQAEKGTTQYFRNLISTARGDEIWMVGNRLGIDIAPARKCGIRTVLLRVGTHREQSSNDPTCCAEYEIKRLMTLPAVIRTSKHSFDLSKG